MYVGDIYWYFESPPLSISILYCWNKYNRTPVTLSFEHKIAVIEDSSTAHCLETMSGTQDRHTHTQHFVMRKTFKVSYICNKTPVYYGMWYNPHLLRKWPASFCPLHFFNDLIENDWQDLMIHYRCDVRCFKLIQHCLNTKVINDYSIKSYIPHPNFCYPPRKSVAKFVVRPTTRQHPEKWQ